jgi:hypothetical protein
MTVLTRLHSYLVTLGVIGIVTIFLPFAHDVSPLDVVIAVGTEIFAGNLTGVDELGWKLTLIASPFCLAIPITVACVRRLWAGGPSRWEWVTAYVLALATGGMTLAIVGWGLFEGVPGGSSLADNFGFFSPLVVLPLGTGWVVRNWRHGLAHALNAVGAMQVAYIASAIFCLVTFRDDWDSGAYVTLVTVIIYLAHSALASLTRFAAAARPGFHYA